jgi:hypothetical protein
MQTLIALPALQEAKAAGLDYEREKAKKTTGLQAERKDKKKRKKNEDPGFSDFAQAQHRQYERLTNALKPDMAAYGKSAKEWCVNTWHSPRHQVQALIYFGGQPNPTKLQGDRPSHSLLLVAGFRGEDEVTADTLAYGQHDAVSSAGLDKMSQDLEKQCVAPPCSNSSFILFHKSCQISVFFPFGSSRSIHPHPHSLTHKFSPCLFLTSAFSRRIEKRGKFSRRRAHHHDADISYINERNMQFNKKLDRYYGKYTQEIRENLERGTAI